LLVIDVTPEIEFLRSLPAQLRLLAISRAVHAEPGFGIGWPILWQPNASEQVRHLRFDLVGAHPQLLTFAAMLDARRILVVATPRR
jgi:hypothetical protein